MTRNGLSTPTRERGRRLRFMAPAVIAAGFLLLPGCSDEDGSGGTAEGDVASAEDFCTRMRTLMERGPMDTSDDPEAAAEAASQIRELADGAPPEVAGALGTFADLMDEIAALETDGDAEGMDQFGEVMALMFDPEVIQAGAELSDYLVTECGFDPEEVDQQFGSGGATTDLDGVDGGVSSDPEGIRSSGEISLEDLEAVEEANSGESWSPKIVSSLVSGTSVQWMGRGEGDEMLDAEPLTTEEAVAACEALRAAFAGEHPDLEVAVGNGDTALVEGSAATPCAAV